MIIRFKVPDGDFVEKEIEKGTSIETLYDEVKDDLKYPCVAAKVDNEYQSLSYVIDGECSVELLDMRTKGASRIYQASISMVFLCAARKVLGDVLCQISNSLNKGFFIELKTKGGSTKEMTESIREEMQNLIDRDLPFTKEYLSREEGIELIKEIGDNAKLRLAESLPDLKYMQFYTLDGYSQFFYTLMVPSTKYVNKFRLEKYKRGFLLRFPDKYNPDGIPDYVDEVNMYKAFAEQNSWDELLGVKYVCDLNEKIQNDDYQDLILLSEVLHDKKITEISNMITEENRRLVLIAGPSSSGKTTFAKRLCIHLRVNGHKALYMGTDDYFLDRDEMTPDENGEYDFEGLDAVDTKLFNHDMKSLLNGEETDLPEFDFKEGKKYFGGRKTQIDKKTVIVIEGIHALNPESTESLPKESCFKIYISALTCLNIDGHNRIPTTDGRLLRRIVRDARTRGNLAKRTIEMWPSVRRGEEENIFPFQESADVMFNSAMIYELAALKLYAEPLLHEIEKDEPEYLEAQRLLKFLGYFVSIPSDKIPINSIAREFVGGSIFKV